MGLLANFHYAKTFSFCTADLRRFRDQLRPPPARGGTLE
jgi:hypothetical protein